MSFRVFGRIQTLYFDEGDELKAGQLMAVLEKTPLRHYLIIVRGIFVKDIPYSVVMQFTYPIAIIAAFTLFSATWFFRKKME